MMRENFPDQDEMEDYYWQSVNTVRDKRWEMPTAATSPHQSRGSVQDEQVSAHTELRYPLRFPEISPQLSLG